MWRDHRFSQRNKTIKGAGGGKESLDKNWRKGLGVGNIGGRGGGGLHQIGG